MEIETKAIEGTKDKRNYVVDFTKLNDQLRFEAQYSIKQGIEEIVDNLNKNIYGLNEDFDKISQYYGNYFIPKKNLNK